MRAPARRSFTATRLLPRGATREMVSLSSADKRTDDGFTRGHASWPRRGGPSGASRGCCTSSADTSVTAGRGFSPSASAAAGKPRTAASSNVPTLPSHATTRLPVPAASTTGTTSSSLPTSSSAAAGAADVGSAVLPPRTAALRPSSACDGPRGSTNRTPSSRSASANAARYHGSCAASSDASSPSSSAVQCAAIASSKSLFSRSTRRRVRSSGAVLSGSGRSTAMARVSLSAPRNIPENSSLKP
mmetsp:Transcript_33807/g.104374  ORF Transcript_33807/g.104374 Transcript_33807/m.104374 type:complete len:245 (+) Transcript_33807:505-1239(+)